MEKTNNSLPSGNQTKFPRLSGP